MFEFQLDALEITFDNTTENCQLTTTNEVISDNFVNCLIWAAHEVPEDSKVKVVEQIEPEIIAFVGGLAGIAAVWGCIKAHYQDRFPFDFYGAPALDDTQCPHATFWAKEYKFCWLIDIFHKIEPALLIGMLVFGIMVL